VSGQLHALAVLDAGKELRYTLKRACVDVVEKREIFALRRESNSDSEVVQSVA
jgi:hypothetical protein